MPEWRAPFERVERGRIRDRLRRQWPETNQIGAERAEADTMTRIVAFMRRLGRDRRGISSVEYALLLAFVGGGIIIAANTLSNAIENQMEATANCINGTDEDCAGQ